MTSFEASAGEFGAGVAMEGDVVGREECGVLLGDLEGVRDGELVGE